MTGGQGAVAENGRAMTCCTPARPCGGPPEDAPPPAPAPAPALPQGDGQRPALVRFAAARSFIGTNQPYHMADGEGPVRKTRLRGFALEAVPVTNARFAAFVAATGYRTLAERFGWSPVFAGAGWQRAEGACWAAPEGPGSDVFARADHPVVHLGWPDARAFARWSGGRLPTEAEWEHAARGGLENPRFPWGDAEPDDEAIHCNIWQGRFPDMNTAADGYAATSPVGAFPANGAGLFDMAGNVWEWTADAFRVHSVSAQARRRNAAAMAANERVMKGGSFLCHRSYCYRYRIAARLALTADSSGSNTGLRVAYDLG